jgi:acetoin utilization deacetylase AcuC-like enzyme
MQTAVVHHPICLKHDTGEGHPETAGRYTAVMNALKGDEALWQNLIEIEAPRAPRGNILACHTPQHFKRVESAAEEGVEYLDADTIVSMQSFDVALHGAGAACRAVDAVLGGDADNAFVAMRPPGHHATREAAMGFCLFNNVAVAARYAQQKYKEIERVAIVDWDVHHGNGTQGIFYDDPTVFFFSIHQYPWYPGTGSRGETGHGRGKNFTLNVPVKARTPAREQRRMFEAAIGDIAGRFKPDLIIISAGFDFIWMTSVVKDWARKECAGRVVSCLEGGYNLKTLGETVRAHVIELKTEK